MQNRLVLQVERRYNRKKESVFQLNKMVEAVNKATVYYIRLHDLMDFNRAFQQYDTLDGANCLTVGKRHLSQREAAMEAVGKIGLKQNCNMNAAIFGKQMILEKAFRKRWYILADLK